MLSTHCDWIRKHLLDVIVSVSGSDPPECVMDIYQQLSPFSGIFLPR